MNNFMSVDGLGQIADNYQAAFVDIWGVVHNGQTAFVDAVQALERFKEECGPVVLVSNSPRPGAAIPAQFAEIGVPDTIYDAIVTSGDAIIAELANRAPGPAFKLGPEKDDGLYKNLDMNFSELERAKFISCTGLFNDDEETPDDYIELLEQAKELGLELVCANPDITVKKGDKLIYCGGALAVLYDKMGGKVVYAGKPYTPIYNLSQKWLDEILGYQPTKDKVLVIGDNILTDIFGAQNQGYDSLFIADGLDTGNEEAVAHLLQKHGIFTKYMLPSLRW